MVIGTREWRRRKASSPCYPLEIPDIEAVQGSVYLPLAHGSPLQCVVSALVVANADRLVYAGKKDFPIADLAGLGGADDGTLNLLHHVVGHYHLNLDFRN